MLMLTQMSIEAMYRKTGNILIWRGEANPLARKLVREGPRISNHRYSCVACVKSALFIY